MQPKCIIIGASHAAAQLSISLRQEGWKGKIHIIGDETYLPYHRPPLSKEYLRSEKTIENFYLRPEKLYAQKDITYKLNTKVLSIEPNKQEITLDNGSLLRYDKLALTVGARARTVDLPGKCLEGINYLRSAKDAIKIKKNLGSAKKVVIVGGGYIGLELASCIRQLGIEVTILEMLPRILARVTAPEVSAFYSRIHSEKGVSIKTNITVSSFIGDTKVTAVKSQDGRVFPADIVIVGIGVVPNTELAEAAGLAIENGIKVDEYARTSVKNIVAAGDCANHPNKMLNRRLRLESVPNAIAQAKTAAATICGNMKPYSSIPWFWSDQYDLKLQMAGLNTEYDKVLIRGDINTGRSFVAYYLKNSIVIAADCINRPVEFMVAKQAFSKGLEFNIDKLQNENIPPKELLN